MKTIEGLRIDYKGDPSVGLFPCFWIIQGEMNFETDEEYKEFENRLKFAFECIVDKPEISETKEEKINFQLPDKISTRRTFAHSCMDCGGTGIVPADFYNQRSTTNTTPTPEKCRNCNGTGTLWGEIIPIIE